jgi:methionyl-tRNA formyltransferase
MKIVYFGNGVRGIKCLDTLLNNNLNVIAVIGHEGNSDVVDFAELNNIITYQPKNINNQEFVDVLEKLNADLFVLSGYSRILKSVVIDLPKFGCINLHGGKLPEYRGCAPINWQIINGETTGGCCIIFVDKGIDTGDIITQKTYEISNNDTSLDIVNKQLSFFPVMLLKAVKDIELGKVKAIVQDKAQGSYYTRRYPEDGLINWDTMTSNQVYNLVRALVDPYPNAFTFYRTEKIKIRKVSMIEPPIVGTPGRMPFKRQNGVVICCKDKGIVVNEIAIGDNGEPIDPRGLFQIGDKCQNHL